MLHQIVKHGKLGQIFVDSTRISCPDASLSAEPDVVFVSKASLAQGRIRPILKAGYHDRYAEFEGPPDLVVEVVSDSSIRKDTKRLATSYFEAGVYEYWIADARTEELRFHIFRRGNSSYEETPPDAEGYQLSTVLNHRFRLARERDETNTWDYDLLAEPI